MKRTFNFMTPKIWNSTRLEVRFDAPKRLGNFRDFSFFLWFTPKKHHKKGIDGGKCSPSLLTSNIWQPFLCFLKTISGFTIYEKKLPPTFPPPTGRRLRETLQLSLQRGLHLQCCCCTWLEARERWRRWSMMVKVLREKSVDFCVLFDLKIWKCNQQMNL